MDEDGAPDVERWLVELTSEEPPLRLPDEQSEEWWHRFSEGIRSDTISGWSRQFLPSDEQLPSRDQWTLTGFDASWLWVVQTSKSEQRLFVVAHEPLTEDSVRPWKDGFRSAMTEMGQRSDFAWRAFIGQGPLEREGHGQVLREAADISGLHLEPGSNPYMEYGPMTFGGGGTVAVSWPVIVTGTTSGYEWRQDAVVAANNALHRLCSLLSVVWNSYWTARTTAELGVYGPTEVPTGVGMEWWKPDEQTPTSQHVVPEWMDEAWATLETRDDLRRAVGAFREGVALQDEHPSMALIAYVAVIETLDDQTPLERCEMCGMMAGSTKRFKASVAAVMSEVEAKQLGVIYDRRSKTAHASHLHGGENLLGIHQGMFYGIAPPDLDFAIESLRPMRLAARRLILVELDQDPQGKW